MIVPEVFNPYLIQRTTELNAVIASGIATKDPDLQWGNTTRRVKGGKTINIPFWKNIISDDDDDEVLSDSVSLTVNNITSDESKAAIHARGKAWSVNDLARYFSGDDPMGAIADMTAGFWANKEQKLLLKSLEGVFACSDMADSKLDISTKSGSDGIVSSNALIDAIYKLGDANGKIQGMMMHSAVMNKLVKLNLISTIRDAEGKILYDSYLSKRVIVDDAIAPVEVTVDESTKYAYPIYFFGAGAVSFNEDTANISNKTDEDILADDTVLAQRRYFVMHPRGMSWEGTASGVTPSYEELADGSNWKLADARKNVAITELLARVD